MQIVVSVVFIANLFGCKQTKEELLLPNIEDGVEKLTDIGLVNQFSNGDKVILEPRDTIFISTITQRQFNSPDSSILKDITAYDFEFRSLPTNITYQIERPSTDHSLAAVQMRDESWIDCENFKRDQDLITLEFTTTFVGTKSTQQRMVEVAFCNTNYFIGSDYQLTKNPSSNNPLSALIEFNTSKSVEATLTIKGQNDNDIVNTFAPNTKHSIPVLALYNNYDNQVELTIRSSSGIVYRKHETIFCNYPIFYNVKIETKFESGFKNEPDELYMALSTGNVFQYPPATGAISEITTLCGYDQWGKIRYLYNGIPSNNIFPIEYKGEKVFSYIVRPDKSTTLYIIDYLGQTIDSLELNNGKATFLHHDVVNVDPNTIAVPWGMGVDDNCGMFEVDLRTKRIISDIDFRDLFGTQRQILTDAGPVLNKDNPVHCNSIQYIESDNTYILSARKQGIFKMSRDGKTIKWIITPHIFLDLPDVGRTLEDVVLQPTNFSVTILEQWPLGQHTAWIMPNGELICFDNHSAPVQGAMKSERYNRVVSYRVDEKNMTVTQVWSYNTPDKYFSNAMGSTQPLATGRVLASWPQQTYACEINYKTDKVVWESNFLPNDSRGFIYRTYKMQMYK